MEPPPLGRADAVFGTDTPTERSDHLEDRPVHTIVINGKPTHVDMDVAVAGVTEQPGLCSRNDSPHTCRDLVDEISQ